MLAGSGGIFMTLLDEEQPPLIIRVTQITDEHASEM